MRVCYDCAQVLDTDRTLCPICGEPTVQAETAQLVHVPTTSEGADGNDFRATNGRSEVLCRSA